MTQDTGTGPTETDIEADAMKDRLRKDVASWSAARGKEAAETFAAPAAKPAAAPVKRVSRAKAAVVEVPAGPVVKKPFKMSYDGTTDRDYIAHRINLGAR